MQRYDGATQVQASLSRGRAKLKPVMREVKRPGKKDLVYIDDSPDYCQKNETLVANPRTFHSHHSLMMPYEG